MVGSLHQKNSRGKETGKRETATTIVEIFFHQDTIIIRTTLKSRFCIRKEKMEIEV